VGFISQLLEHMRRAPPASPHKSAPVEPLSTRPTASATRKPAADPAAEPREKEGGKLAASFRQGIVDARFLDLDVDRRFLEGFDRMVKSGGDALVVPTAAASDAIRRIDEPTLEPKKIAESIASEATLAAVVEALARSPLHGGASASEALSDAIARLGQGGTRLVVLEAALRASCNKGRPFEDFSDLTFKHSLLTAQLARSLATAAQLDPDQAHVAGLFHDVGVFAVVAAARQLSLKEQRPVSKQTVLQLISRDAASFEQRLVALWKLPAAVAAAVVHRRAPEGAGEHAPLAAATQLANDVCRHFGAWAPQKAVDFAAHPALKLLKIEADKVPARADVMAMAEKVEQVAPLH
jgi:HD-like signal output (HDOD) protein